MTTPTPLPRACARVLALLLAAVLPASAGVVGWKEVRAKLVQKDYVYYYPVMDGGRPVVTNEGGHATIRLYKKPVVSDAEKARSHLYSLDRGRTYKLHLIAEDGPERDLHKGITDFTTQAAQAAPPPPPPTTRPAAPEGVDADVWADVQAKYGAGLSAEDQVLLGKVLTHVKRNNAAQYPAVQAWLQKDARANAAKVVQSARAKGVPAAAGELVAWATASPSGAGPAPADPASGPGAAPRPSQPAAPPVGEGRPVGDQSPQTQLREAMKQEARWPDVAGRIIEWAWAERAEGRSFILPDARRNANTKPAFEAAMKEVVQDKAYWASAINVYYVLGPGGSVPAWATQDPALKKLLVDDQARIKAAGLEGVLAQCLDRWQHNPKKTIPEKCDKTIDRTQVRVPYPPSGQAGTWPRDFLADASRESVFLLTALQAGATNIRTGIGDSPTTVGDPPGGGGERRGRLPAMPTSEFGIDHLFGKWGDPNVFFLDGRVLAVVVRTNKKVEPGEPPRTVLTHQMGLYDISNAGDVYGRRFDITPGEQSLQLTPGGKTYAISLAAHGDDIKVAVTRPGGPPPEMSDGGKELPTVNDLFRNRARQALDSGNRVVVGGRVYRVTGEATATGNVLFWDEKDLLRQAGDIESDKPGNKARYWVPNMMAEVDEMRDGRVQNISDKVALGMNVNGKWQGLKWENGMWVPAEGDEYKPKAPPPPAPPAGGTPPGGTPPPSGGTPGTPPPPGQGRPGLAAALNAKLSEEVKPITGFLDVDAPKKFGDHLIVARLDSAGKPVDGRMSHPQYAGLVDGAGAGDLREDIVGGRWLQTSSSKGYKFLDLKNFDLVKEGAGLKMLGEAGELVRGERFSGVRDKTVLAAMLKLAGYTGDESKVLANLDQALKGSSNWAVSGLEKSGGGRISVVVDNRNCSNIWPRLTLGDCAGASEQSPGSVPGAGSGLVLDAAGNIQFDANLPFGETWQNTEGRTAARVDPKPNDAALYMATTADDGRKQWYLSFVAAGADNKKVKRMPSLVFQEQKQGAAKTLGYPKKAVTISGVVVKGAPDQSYSLRAVMVGDSLEDSGFIGAYTSSTNDSCVGVVASWGVTHADACGRCGAKWRDGRCYSEK